MAVAMSYAEYAQFQWFLALMLLGALILLTYLLARYEFGPRGRERRRMSPPVALQNADLTMEFNLGDDGEHLRAVMSASFEKRRILKSGEYGKFRMLEKDLASLRPGFRVLAQTSLGAVLTSPDTYAFHAINTRRVDILILDESGFPLLAVEYLGERHFQGAATARDTIKKEALRKAGVRYLAIPAECSEAQIRQRVRERLGIETASGGREATI
jgi:hypothetical protein